ncbi:MAG: TonB-dependent receptor [Opitutaceae bacterium]|jgi:hypothetical protein|nr:TonB-dependent receptor [Opitutaceae bacterium]
MVFASGLVTAAELGEGGVGGEPVELDRLTVFSTRVALQEPTGTVAAPVSALRFEPQVDVQGRGFAEAQADVTIRGGTFENTGFSVGALPIYDPQTGHYSAELPASPHMMDAPEVRVGGAHAATAFGATAGTVAYGWRPIETGGAASVGAGGDDLARAEIYSGFAAEPSSGGWIVASDVSVARAQSDGAWRWRDPNPPFVAAPFAGIKRSSSAEFQRVAGRVQLRNARSQTDVFAGYQDKDFAWPNLYAARPNTPLRAEREQLQTKLVLVNHRTQLETDGDFVQGGAYYRGHRDNYSIPGFGVSATNPSRHQTVVRGAAFDGRKTVREGTALRYAAGVVGDDLDSNTLNTSGPGTGRFMSRTQVYGTLQGEQTFVLSETRELVLSAGGRYDDSNRDGSEASPLASVELRQSAGTLRRAYLSYSESTQLPTYQALNSSPGGLFGGNPDLPRATAQNVELGADWAAGGWTMHTAVFRRQDDNLLDYIFDPTGGLGTSRRAAAADILTHGVELFAQRSWERFDLLLGYTFFEKDDEYLPPFEGSFYALNYAEHRLTVGGVVRLGGGLELRMDNELRRQADNALRREGNDNVDTAVGLFYRVPGVKGLVLNAQVENLWDTAYQDVPLVPHSPRSWSVGASYAW